MEIILEVGLYAPDAGEISLVGPTLGSVTDHRPQSIPV